MRNPLARLAALAALLIAGCRPAQSTPEIIADCFWSAQAYAWIDADADGVADADEQPLEGVEVNFSLNFYSGGATGPDGLASVSGMHPGGCDTPVANNIVATAPEGYTATTELTLPYSDDQDRYEFGFQPIGSVLEFSEIAGG
jgi:hypothetical protein